MPGKKSALFVRQEWNPSSSLPATSADADDGELRWRSILTRYLPSHEIQSLTKVRSGFSGASVVQVETPTGWFALRGWPPHSVSRERLSELHRFVRYVQSRGLPVAVPCLPRPVATWSADADLVGTIPMSGACGAEASWIVYDSRWWQLEPWLPGVSAHQPLTDEQLRSLMETLAELHLAASEYSSTATGRTWFSISKGVCPAVLERRRIIQEWIPSRVARGHESLRNAPDAFRQLGEQILHGFIRQGTVIDGELARLERVAVPLFPCWRDLWSDHVLFHHDQVTGLIDPAAARTDHVSTDLSRLLGSLFADDRDAWRQALELYRCVRPLSPEEDQLIRVMDRSSVLLSGLTWIDRWERGTISVEAMERVTERMARIVSRLTRLAQSGSD